MKSNKLTLLIFGLLIILPPFFTGGRNILLQDGILILIGLLILLSQKYYKKILFNYKYSPNIFLLLFLTFSFFGVFFSSSPFISAVEWLRYLSYAMLFLVLQSLNLKKPEINKLLQIFLGTCLAIAIIGVYFYVTGSYSRLTSTFYWPNPMASYLLLALPISFCYLINNQKIAKSGLLVYFIFFFLLLAFFLTFSRGASLALVAGFLAYLAIDYKAVKEKLLIIILILIISGGGFFLVRISKNSQSFFVHKLINQNGILDTSSAIRLDYWRGAIDIFKDNIFFGSGLGTFQAVYPGYQNNPISAGKYPHNLYLEILAESGGVAFALFILFLFFVYFKNFGILKKNDYALPLYIGTIIFLIHNIVDIGWHFPAGLIIFWILFGLITGMKQEENSNSKYSKFFGNVLLFISLGLLVAGLIFFYQDYNYIAGQRYERDGNLNKALEKYNNSVIIYPNPDYLRRKGIIQFTLGSYDNASATANKLTRIDSKNSLNYELAGKINYAQKNLPEAENNFRQAIILDKYNHPLFYYDYALVLLKQNKKEEAKKILREILGYYPKKAIQNRRAVIMANQDMESNIEGNIKRLEDLLNSIDNR